MKKSAEAKRVAAVKRKLLRAVEHLVEQMTDGESLAVRAKLYQEVEFALMKKSMQLAVKASMGKTTEALIDELRQTACYCGVECEIVHEDGLFKVLYPQGVEEYATAAKAIEDIRSRSGN